MPELLARVGWSGVTIFFALSGFLLTLLYYPQFSRGLTFASFKAYFLKRVARIYPLYYFVLVVAAVTLPWNPYLADRPHPGWLDFGAHLVMVHGLFGDFATSYIPPAWSLTIEESFYLLLPLSLLLLARLAGDGGGLARTARFAAALAGLTAAAVGIGFLTDRFLTYRPHGFFANWVNETIFGQMPTFALGMLAGAIYRRHRGGPLFTRAAWGNLLGSAGVALYVFGAWVFGDHKSWMEGFAGQAVFGGAATLFILSLCGRSVFATVLGLRPFVYGGRISYALYLISTTMAFKWFFEKVGVVNAFQHYLGVLILSALLYHLIEKPCHTWLRKRWAPRAAPAPAAPPAVAPAVVPDQG
jgi:peptidoglycan/LPS O-acetylase OafA/YrhL